MSWLPSHHSIVCVPLFDHTVGSASEPALQINLDHMKTVTEAKLTGFFVHSDNLSSLHKATGSYPNNTDIQNWQFRLLNPGSRRSWGKKFLLEPELLGICPSEKYGYLLVAQPRRSSSYPFTGGVHPSQPCLPLLVVPPTSPHPDPPASDSTEIPGGWPGKLPEPFFPFR